MIPVGILAMIQAMRWKKQVAIEKVEAYLVVAFAKPCSPHMSSPTNKFAEEVSPSQEVSAHTL